MLIKSIRCQVEEQKKESFSKGQTQWEPISAVKGFMGQLGGWCEQNPNQAWIIAFWENPSTYQQFMEEVHDRIFLDSGQEKTYTAIHVDFFEMNHQPEQIASLVDHAEILKVETIDSMFRILEGKSSGKIKVSAKTSALTQHSVPILSDKIQLEEAWRVVPGSSGV